MIVINMTEHNINVIEHKVFPEEDYEYEGTINGKDFEGRKEQGRMAIEEYEAVEEDEELTDEELEAIKERVKEKFW